MADQSMVFQKVLIGPEADLTAATLSAGTAVVPTDAADAKTKYIELRAASVTPTGTINKSEAFTPNGSLVPTTQSTLNEESTLSYESSTPSFQETPLIAASVLHYVGDTGTIPTVNDGYVAAKHATDDAWCWVFDPKAGGIQSPLTFTVMNGDLETFHRITYGLFTGMQVQIATQSGVSVSGSGIGRRMEHNTDTDRPFAFDLANQAAVDALRDNTIGNDSGATAIGAINDPQITMNSTCVDIFIADTFEGLHDTTAATFTDASWVSPVYPLDDQAFLSRCTTYNWGIDNRWSPFRQLDCDYSGGMVFHTTQRPSGTMKFQTTAAGDPFSGKNPANPHVVAGWDGKLGMHLVNLVRNNNYIWTCARVRGPLIGATTHNYEMRLYACVLLQNPTLLEDQSLKAISVDGSMVRAPAETNPTPDFARLVVINANAGLLG